MLSKPSSRSPARLVAVLGALLVAALLVPTTAAADDDSGADSRDLLTYLPDDSRFASRVDVDRLRQSKYFDRALDYLEENADLNSEVFDAVTDEEGFDVRADLDGIVFGLPVARVDASSQVERVTCVLDGEFDKRQIVETLEKRHDKLENRTQNGLDVHRVEDVEFAVPTSDRLIMTMGPKSYRNDVWSVVADGGSSFEQTADKHGLLDGLDTSRTIWMVNHLKGTQNRASAKVDSAGISLSLDDGADLQVVTRVASKPDAEAVVQQVEMMKKRGSESAMLTMFGAGPLIANLEVERDGTTVVATTSMTETELEALVEKVGRFAASQSRMSIPSSGAPSGSGQSDSDDDSSTTPNDDATKN